ncbi:integrase arm-type DNA-binding domain-containing protein [Candidatus Regiella insecticola]|uniref:integrase arm-type DNA-binding domain-containing protein n=1 Tax=Candidatus Regiella insecticola TaxID=138073 RepID=UPI0002E7FD10|nr:integrase arm-type DNA-binding domain-containing protein [Candidatus Regiella insecticola]
MAIQAKPLTNTEVKAAKTIGKDLSLHDGGSLLLFVKTSGVKTWRFRYYHPLSKKRTTVTFGHYPALSLAEARQKREAAKALLAKKIDPQEYQRTILASEQAARINTWKRLPLSGLKLSNPVSRQTMPVMYGDRLNVIFFLWLDR